MMIDITRIHQQLEALKRQETGLRNQADVTLEQLTMTKGAIQILEKLLLDVKTEQNTTEESADGDA